MLVDYQRFLAVADRRNISSAADELNVSQPALSRTIRQLEDAFGTRLFRRTGSGMELTEAGRTLYLYASRAVRALQSAQEEIGHFVEQQRLTLRVCCGDSWGYGVLPEVVNAFAAEAPEVTVQVDLLEHNARLRGIETRNYDLAFGIVAPETLATGRYVFEPLLQAPYDIYCDAAHPLLDRAKIARADLLDYHWINHRFEYDFDPSLALRTRRVFARRSNTMLHALETMRGSQLLLSTAKTMAPIFQRFNLVPLMEDPESPNFVSGILCLSRVELSSVTRRFLALTRASCLRRWGPVGELRAALPEATP
ncbi:LysR family transcriptional regulator [Salipiger abyssi]|uniref:LysR family transcriptional regulator n=1 Tax=Salipiger abyssi TaxID=1250539 RepID=UPI00405833E7